MEVNISNEETDTYIISEGKEMEFRKLSQKMKFTFSIQMIFQYYHRQDHRPSVEFFKFHFFADFTVL